ncbi:rhodanese [Primorskyibacter flagellatus]|uniref:Rhodanese n=2 Tax=Primorskyibacter flagellatus TaxID=1387277 RepID=A0A917EFL1_9RHOB|nr:rhodanese [Primorskyibacter flagellatus]
MTAARAILATNQHEESDMKRIKDMVAEANAVVTHAPAEEMKALHGQDGVTFVDLRDPRELERDGMIPGAFHCPRGMLEFWIDPESPYAKPQFQTGNRFVFYCASGWRSALSARTAQEMGLENVSHITDGFGGWKKAGAPVGEKPARKD